MTETQLKERRVARKKWKNKRAKGKSAAARTDQKLVRGIGNQIHADIFNTKENDYNPKIDDVDREHAFRYCRPGTSLPMLASEIELIMYDDQKLERELIHQRDSFLVEYSKERKRRVKKNEDSLVWQDLEKIIDDIDKKRKQSIEEQLEREKELEEAERKKKEAKDKEEAEQLQREEEEKAEIERKEKLKRMSRFEQIGRAHV